MKWSTRWLLWRLAVRDWVWRVSGARRVIDELLTKLRYAEAMLQQYMLRAPWQGATVQSVEAFLQEKLPPGVTGHLVKRGPGELVLHVQMHDGGRVRLAP